MCCAKTARVDYIGEKICCKYRDTEIVMSVSMDELSVVGDAEKIRRKLEIAGKQKHWKGLSMV